MSLDNLQRAVYVSPSGQTVDFDYEDVEISVDKKTSIFETADGDGSYVQDNGHTSGLFPMACIFHGDGYADAAEAFMSALLERGVGTLIHPIHDSISVVPVGKIKRTDTLKSGAGQTIFTVEFFETIEIQPSDSQESAAGFSFDNLNKESYLEFSETVNVTDPGDKAALKVDVIAGVDRVKSGIKVAIGAVENVQGRVDDIADSIFRGVDSVLNDPLTLARQCQLLLSEPRRIGRLLSDKIAAYKNMADTILYDTIDELSIQAANTFRFNSMLLQSILANWGMAAIQNKDWYARYEYVDAARSLLTAMDEYRLWYDTNFAYLDGSLDNAYLDTGGGMESLSSLITLAAGLLIKRSFGAKTEMRAETTEYRVLVELCYELYGSLDAATLDNFIAQNEFVGDEFYLIPKGREIVWYV